MKKTILTAIMVAFGLGLVGCGDTANDQGKEQVKEAKKPVQEQVYTYNYYMENIEETKKQVEFCKNLSTMNEIQEKNCANAQMAYSRLAGSGKFINSEHK